MTDVITKTAQQFLLALPHAAKLGMAIEEASEGQATVSMPYSTDLIGDPMTQVVHGGAVSALMDTAGGTAVITHPKGGLGTATLDLRIDYMRSAKPGQTIIAQAHCHHVTRSIAFVRATAFDDDRENPVAMATGVFTVPRKGGMT